jgi:hypothetical protein
LKGKTATTEKQNNAINTLVKRLNPEFSVLNCFAQPSGLLLLGWSKLNAQPSKQQLGADLAKNTAWFRFL